MTLFTNAFYLPILVFGILISAIAKSNEISSVNNSSIQKQILPKDSARTNASTPFANTVSGDTLGISTEEVKSLPTIPQTTISETTPVSSPEDSLPLSKKILLNYDNFSVPCLYNSLLYEKNFSLKTGLSFLYYNEKISMSDIIDPYKERYGLYPETIVGQPLSTEYGIAQAFSFTFTKIVPQTGFLIRPGLSIKAGLANTYKGSSQGVPIISPFGDTVGINFETIDTTKTNLFIATGMDLGYCNRSYPSTFALYSGLHFNFWYRDMLSNSEVVNYENYYWFAIPLGLIAYFPLGQKWNIGFEGVINCMFFGAMHAVTKQRSNEDINIAFPEVTLGNKAGFRFDIIFEHPVSEHFAFQVIPYYSIYGFGKSNIDTAEINIPGYSTDVQKIKFSFFEPASATSWVGINLAFNLWRSPISRSAKK